MGISQRLAVIVFLSAIFVAGAAFLAFSYRGARPETESQEGRVAGALSPLQLRSPAFADQEMIPPRYTCDGENVSPPLEISNVPAGARSLALLVEDVDAPAGSFWHWFVGNLNPQLKLMRENHVPAGAFLSINDFGQKAYGGPCPPTGRHRYLFHLYALDRELPYFVNVTKGDLVELIKSHTLAQATLTGFYRR